MGRKPRTIALSSLPRTTILVHLHQRHTLFLNQRICYNANIQQPSPKHEPTFLPASLLMPSLPTTTQEASQIPQRNLSLSSFSHPHFDAATASIAAGLLAYVDSLNVASRERKEGIEDGRYSEFECSGVKLDAVRPGALNESELRVRVAVRASIAAR